MISWSLNEIEALALKAARGSGMSWGLAEEAGRAVRCLEAHGIYATEVLVRLLEVWDRGGPEGFAPFIEGNIWRAPGGALCPIIAGSSLSDFADLLPVNAAIHMERVAYPVFLLPFVQMAAQRLGRVICLGWPGAHIYVQEEAIYLQGGRAALLCDEARVETGISAKVPAGQRLPISGRARPSASVIARLSAFAHRTYAPATEASRLRGAGAGLRDND